ncbi:hypothetical protein [Megasphaera sp.]|uniref:hypothetical protein n=1 Tax=Megasphaera sp. TaxID=2023260 RepID=UPI00352184B1
MRNGFFSFSILALTGLMLTMAMTTAVLARAQLLSVQTDEEKVRLTYLAESALREGWQELQAEPERLLSGAPLTVTRTENIAADGERIFLTCRFDRTQEQAGGYLQAVAEKSDQGVQQTCGLVFEAVPDEAGKYALHRCYYRD